MKEPRRFLILIMSRFTRLSSSHSNILPSIVRVLTCLLTFLAVFGYAKASSPENQRSDSQFQDANAFLTIRESKVAEVVIEETKKVVYLESAVLEFNGFTLQTGFARIDSEAELATLWGGVEVLTDEDALFTERVELDAHSGELRIPQALVIQSKTYRFTSSADSANLYYLKDTNEPFKLVLLGSVKVNYADRADLVADKLVYTVRDRLLSIEGAFTLSFREPVFPVMEISNRTLTEDSVVGSKLTGDGLFCNLRESPSRTIYEITVVNPQIYQENAQVKGKNLTSRFTYDETSNTFQPELLLLSGTSAEPVIGRFSYAEYQSVDIITQRLEANGQSEQILLSGRVEIRTPDVTIKGERMVVDQVSPTLAVTIPERFRAEFAEKFIRNLFQEPDADTVNE